jgi:uncharacterized protein
MLGNLNEHQINNLLSSQVVGRIACTDGKLPYIVPVTYVFDGKYIYGQTREGMKLAILRKNPEVCFQVDVMTDMRHWQSVQVRGKFEELKGEEATEKQSYLLNRVMPIMTGSVVHAHQHATAGEIEDDNRVKPVVYRIKIQEKTGRFENL